MDTQSATAPEAGQNSESAAATTAPAADKGEPTFTPAQVEAIIKDRLNRQKASLDAAADKARQDAEAVTLAEQGKYKDLYEQAEAARKQAEGQVATAARALLIARLATAANLPGELWSRVQGEDEDAIKADIAALAALVKSATPAPGTGNNPARNGQPNAEQERLARQRQGSYRL